ncbi:putative metallopeptidase WLM domain protein [Tupanvirus soda lake]|uniref:Metallopeptidase WLM domain protein n=2 Tax=Tupanvirus TaxID=2094720 RepID=A0AC62ABR6_9VIRU|nr:putative metallopeptidase WLM domain protein [Tupanvirus soda lake]QKU35085.1 putative metallopeptidase WLM domain protein [Tupanvirus soda lake]
MNKSIIIQILLVVLLIILIYYFDKLSKSEAIYVRSRLNNREYLVQNLENKEEATYMLSIIHKRIFILRDYLEKNIDKYPEFKEYIKQFCDRINGLVLLENAPDGKYTSYTVNKGDEIALCLRSRKNGELHDLNLIMYVVIHELAHVACPEIDHTELFKKIFIFFLNMAILLKIYKKIDYQKYPHEYCGLTINENLLKN